MKKTSILYDDGIAERVVATFVRLSTKGKGGRRTKDTLVLDHNIGGLAVALKDAGYHVIAVPAGADDHEEIKPNWLPKRIFVTRNTKHFKADAVKYNYGIIALEGLDFIDSAPTLAENITARIIDQGHRKYRLAQVQTKFILEFKKVKRGKSTTRKDVFVDFAPETRKKPRGKRAKEDSADEFVIVYKFRQLG